MQLPLPESVQVSEEPDRLVLLLPQRVRSTLRWLGGLFVMIALLAGGVGAIAMMVWQTFTAMWFALVVAIPVLLLAVGCGTLGLLLLSPLGNSRSRIVIQGAEIVVLDNLGPLRRTLSLAVAEARGFYVAALVPWGPASERRLRKREPLARIQAVMTSGTIHTLAPGYPLALLAAVADELCRRCGLPGSPSLGSDSVAGGGTADLQE